MKHLPIVKVDCLYSTSSEQQWQDGGKQQVQNIPSHINKYT